MQNGDSHDIRNDVEDNRSILKKIQLLVPGFSGYRQKEDIRIADQLLRSQVSGIFLGTAAKYSAPLFSTILSIFDSSKMTSFTDSGIGKVKFFQNMGSIFALRLNE